MNGWTSRSFKLLLIIDPYCIFVNDVRASTKMNNYIPQFYHYTISYPCFIFFFYKGSVELISLNKRRTHQFVVTSLFSQMFVRNNAKKWLLKIPKYCRFVYTQNDFALLTFSAKWKTDFNISRAVSGQWSVILVQIRRVMFETEVC